jgi:hypothetical protein
MPAEKRKDQHRGVTAEIRVAASGGAARVDGAERTLPRHWPVAVRGGDPGRKGVSSSGKMDAGDPLPIWLAALLAARCQATGNGEEQSVRWICSSGRALYTNARAHAVRIEPLGVTLQEGHTLAVCWEPGETTYNLEVFRQYDHCA